MFDFLKRIANLQAFEVDGTGGGAGDGANDGAGAKPTEKTFSQEEVNAIAAKEKNVGKRSMLKSLGFDSEEEAESFLAKARELVNGNKTNEEQLTESLKLKTAEFETAKAELDNTKNAIEALKFGASVEHVDNVVLLASAKVSADENIDFSTALKEIKELYPSMFNKSSKIGTGSLNVPPKKNVGDGENLGLKLGKKANKKTNNSYFKH